ncbi:MAG: histidine kinase [Clostridia bacterium]|nr:histidine kinase [Clostridia bacterium]MBQ6722722.1 histidine kinase [Clostridia bacterium]
MDKKPESGHGIRTALASLRVQIMVLLVLCWLIPALVLSVFIQTSLIPALRSKTASALDADAEHAWTQACQNIDGVIAQARDAIYDGELTSVYDSWRAGSIGDAEYLRLSRSYVDRKYSRNSLLTFAAYFPVEAPGMYMYTRSGYHEAVAFLNRLQQQALRLGETLDTRSRFLEAEGQLYLIRNLMNLRMERYGMLVLGLQREALLAPLLELAESWHGQVSIQLDDSGDTGVDWADIPSGMTAEGQEIRFCRRVSGDEYTLRLLLTMNKREQYRENYTFQYLALTLYLLLIPVLVLLAFYVRRRIIMPVTLLTNASRRIERGELGVTVPMRGDDELGELGVTFSNMSRRIEQLIDKTYKEELELKNAQIQALQSRINPHFINNALEAINWQARIEKSESIPAMVDALSVLLGASMARQNRRMVTLREEMKVADAYIYFIQQRFGSDLTVTHLTEDEGALDCMVPLLTVQPVLENAVEHGIAPAGRGEIILACRRAGGCVRLEVINTGRGIGPEDRRKIDAALLGETGEGSHLGLANIASRLRLIYGGRASMEVFSDDEGRTVVRVDIPQDGDYGEETA